MKRVIMSSAIVLFLFCLFNAAASPATIDITMRDAFFQPQNVTITAGDTVRWTNQGVLLHTTTSGVDCTPDGKWDSGLMSNGQTFSFTFNQHEARGRGSGLFS